VTNSEEHGALHSSACAGKCLTEDATDAQLALGDCESTWVFAPEYTYSTIGQVSTQQADTNNEHTSKKVVVALLVASGVLLVGVVAAVIFQLARLVRDQSEGDELQAQLTQQPEDVHFEAQNMDVGDVNL